MPAPFPLRAYQQRAIRDLRVAYGEGKRRILLVSPTGSGKTAMCSSVVQGWIEKSADSRAAWFAHRRELCAQGAESLTRWGLDVGYAGAKASARTQVVSTAGALSRGEVPTAGLVVLDEAHHYSADTWRSIPAAYPDGTLVLGATATPERGDGRPLDHLFEHLIVVAHPHELVATGDLVPCITHRPGRLQRKGRVAQLPVDAYIHQGLMGKRMVVFASNVTEAGVFLGQFKLRGIDARMVHGAMPVARRDEALEEFRNGTVRVLINVYVLTEGWDCHDVEVVCMARKCGSQSMLMQAVGRGLRPAPGKTACHFLDLCGVTHILGDPMEERVYSLDGEGIARKGAVPGARYCKVCGDIIPDGSTSCGCGASSEMSVGTASGDPLERFAKIRLDDESGRAARLARWVAEARSLGHKWQAACFRYRAAYGGAPPADIVSHALAIADGRQWCRECKHSKCRCHEKAGA